MLQKYLTIREQTEGFYKEKGSKFMAFAYPIQSLAEMKEKVDSLKKQFHDARHHCFAHLIQEGDQIYMRANDDGEPNHSAGDPILGQLKSFDLMNVLVVVVRYFGGTKLGVSGLVHAYRTAAQDALAKAKIIEVVYKDRFEINYPYEKSGELMRIINEFEVEIVGQDFMEVCTLTGLVLPENFNLLKTKFALMGLTVNLTLNER